MFFSTSHLSETDKIDRIYRMLRSQQRARRFSFFIKVLILGSIVYGFYYLSLPEHTDIRKQVNDLVEKKMMEFITPMVDTMVQNLTNNPVSSSDAGITPAHKNQPKTTTIPAITPEMIKAVQDSMKKK